MSNCHNCVFHQTIPGDCHISCGNPVVVKNALTIVASLHSGMGYNLIPILGFTMSQHGIDNGWANFPLNYDPIWIEGECKLKILKKDENEQSQSQT